MHIHEFFSDRIPTIVEYNYELEFNSACWIAKYKRLKREMKSFFLKLLLHCYNFFRKFVQFDPKN